MNRTSSLLVKLLAATSLTVVLPAAAADPASEARVHFDRALELYEERYFDGALAELKKAYELKPSYKLLYNIGQVQLAMHDFAAALGSYREYLDKGGAEVVGARRTAVEQELAKLEQRVARLTIDVDATNAEVFVDDISVGTTPLAEPLVLNSGTRRVSVRHPEYAPQTRRLTLVGGSREKLVLTLKVEPSQGASQSIRHTTAPKLAPTPPVPQPAHAALPSGTSLDPARPTSADKRIPWIPWAITGALATGAGVVGLVALSKNSSLENERDRLGADPEKLDADASRVRTLAVVTDGLIVAAVAAAGVSLWLTLAPASHQTRGSLDPQRLQVGVGPSGVAIRSHFF